MYVCMYVRTYVRTYVRMYIYILYNVYVCVRVCIYKRLYLYCKYVKLSITCIKIVYLFINFHEAPNNIMCLLT